jgi:hypothetical protein
LAVLRDRKQTDASSDRGARAFVYAVWLVMSIVNLYVLTRYARNLPLTEDWLLVPALTGNESDLLGWIWEQNNEHRVPLPKLILLALLLLAGGDFRAGALFNVSALALVALAAIETARRLRGGRATYTDAFFPLLLLHLGHWENLYWSWQVTFVVPVALALVLCMFAASGRALETRRSAVAAGLCLIGLPLCGGVGLVWVPAFVTWFVATAWRHRWMTEGEPPNAAAARILLVSSGIAALLACVYFIGYLRPAWVPQNPGSAASVASTLQFLALGLGPAARSSWVLSITLAGVILGAALVAIARGVVAANGLARVRALELLLYFGAALGFAAVLGWGRASVIEIYGEWPLRYALLATLPFAAAYFIFEGYLPPRASTAARSALCGCLGLFAVPNGVHGIAWGDWYLAEAAKLEAALQSGASTRAVAGAHNTFAFHAVDASELAGLMEMLNAADIGPFAELPDAAATPRVPVTVRYRRPDAAEVALVWGVHGWQALPPGESPPGTYVENGVMRTPMVRDETVFEARLELEERTLLDYGFLVTRMDDGSQVALWETDEGRDHRVVVGSSSAVIAHERHASALREPRTSAPQAVARIIVRYRLPGAGDIAVVWGIDEWAAVELALRPPGTTLDDRGTMVTPMARRGDYFEATLTSPVGAALNFGFLTRDREGLFDVVRDVWDWREDYRVVPHENRVIEVRSEIVLAQFATIVSRHRYALAAALVGLLATWAAMYAALRPRRTGSE